MEHQKIINFLDNTGDLLSKFITKTWIEVNGYTNNIEYNPISQFKFGTAILESSFCDYGHVHVLVKETINKPGADSTPWNTDKRNM